MTAENLVDPLRCADTGFLRLGVEMPEYLVVDKNLKPPVTELAANGL